MTERLIDKIDRLAAEAGIKDVTPALRKFALLVREDTVAEWPSRPWVGLTEDELLHIGVATGLERAAAHMIESKLKEKNT